jgi:GDPmannose 4,6-dehydratase
MASVEEAIRQAAPGEIYNLAGQSSVGLSFQHPLETLESTCSATLNILEAIRHGDPRTRLFNAGSAECFGDTQGVAADENMPLRPGSPYAVGKAAATWLAATYREAHGLFVGTGILFNHESPLRPERFVTQKIVRTACRISAGSGERLQLGNIAVARDWGWAPEYVEAMWLMLQQASPADFVLATGETHPLADFVREVFAVLGLDWHEHVESDPGLLRPTDIPSSVADPRRARELLGWEARTKMAGVARKMVDAERERIASPPDPMDELSE